MMKSVADALQSFHNQLYHMKEKSGSRSNLLTQCQMMVNDVWAVIEDNDMFDHYMNDLIDAMRQYTGNGNLSSVLHRSAMTDEKLFEIVINKLVVLKDALKLAKPASEAKLMGGIVDVSEVSDPF